MLFSWKYYSFNLTSIIIWISCKKISKEFCYKEALTYGIMYRIVYKTIKVIFRRIIQLFVCETCGVKLENQIVIPITMTYMNKRIIASKDTTHSLRDNFILRIKCEIQCGCAVSGFHITIGL